MAIVFVVVAGLFLFRTRGYSISYMRIRVVNDTQRTVKVQPCWDLACYETINMRQAIVRAGSSRLITGLWSDDAPHTVVVGVLRPRAEAFHFEGCLHGFFNPGLKVGLMHVSQEGICPTSDGVGGG
jgi:hypothetical protein